MGRILFYVDSCWERRNVSFLLGFWVGSIEKRDKRLNKRGVWEKGKFVVVKISSEDSELMICVFL